MSRRAAPSPNADDPLTADATRFGATLRALLRDDASGRVLLAVSGGADSMAMTALAAHAGPTAFIAATVDHGLRPDAAREADMVAAYCASVGIPHTILRPRDPIAGASIQAQARHARYALLADHAARQGAIAIATAHHADDQAETLLMRAARGSGMAGLAGVRPRTLIAGMPVVRPLRDWRRAALRALVSQHAVPFVDDPANDDIRHDRTRFRRLLADNEWLEVESLARSAAALAETDEDLRAMTEWLWTDRAAIDGDGVTIAIGDMPREMRRRLARRAIADVRATACIDTPTWNESANVEALLDSLDAGKRATQAGIVVTPGHGKWHFRPAPPRRKH